jgi:TIR domain
VPEIPALTELAEVVLEGLADGESVEIDGLGIFVPDPARGFRFQPHPRPKIFLAYVVEDLAAAGRLYDRLELAGFSPWMDTRKLLAGQNWPRAIELAIESADLVVACFSSHSVNKRGGFPAEIRYALDCARRVPLDDIFLVPVRFDRCPVPRSIQREWQYIDLFPDWDHGLDRLISAIRQEMGRRRKAALRTV